MGPSYANLLVSFIEHQFFSQYHGPKPKLCGCCIYNCIGATSSTREELTQFITAVNSFHSALKHILENFRHFFGFSRHQISIEGHGMH